MNWDKDVLLKIVDLFTRVNSKRIMSFAMWLMFLWIAKPDFQTAVLSAVMLLILWAGLIWHPGGDKMGKG